MTKIFTPVQAVASAGLLQNTGLGIPSSFTSAVTSFNTAGLTQASQTALTTNSNVAVRSALLAVPEYLTGIVPTSMRSLVPSNITSSFNFNNLVADVRAQADRIMVNGAIGLTDILTQVDAFSVNSFDTMGAFDSYKNLTFADFGHTINSYKDIITSGLNSQYSDVVGGTNKQITVTSGTIPSGYATLVNEFGNFGTMYDIRQLSKLHDPRTLCSNLISQGFYFISQSLVAAGVDVSNMATADLRQVNSVLANIKGVDLNRIVTVTNFVPYKSLNTLLDVMDASRVLSPTALSAAGSSLTALSNKLVNMGGEFNSFADLKKTYASIMSTDLPHLDGLSSLAPASLFTGSYARLGTGVGPFGNPIVSDIIGSVGGVGYTGNITAMTNAQAGILGTEPGQTLRTAIVAAQTVTANVNYTQVAANIVAATAAVVSSTNTAVVGFRTAGQTAYTNIFNRLLVERKNLALTGINLVESVGSNSGITAFVLALHSIQQDPMMLQYADLINILALDSVYGEAIKASIMEGANINQLIGKGIESYTKVDSVERAAQVLAELNC
jgi:hypothetical protein